MSLCAFDASANVSFLLLLLIAVSHASFVLQHSWKWWKKRSNYFHTCCLVADMVMRRKDTTLIIHLYYVFPRYYYSYHSVVSPLCLSEKREKESNNTNG